MIFDMLSTLCGCPSSSHRTIALVYGSQVDARQPATAQNMFWQLLFVVSLDNKRQVDHNVPVEATIVSTHARPRAAAAAMPYLAYFTSIPVNADAIFELPTSHVTSKYRSVMRQSCCSFRPRMAGLVPMAFFTIQLPSAMRGITCMCGFIDEHTLRGGG